MKTPKNHYQILEVNPRASHDVIMAAYRTLSAKYPEDIAPDKFKAIQEAKLVLLDPDNRAEYDSGALSIADKIIGNYRVLSPIAEGGFGATYKGEHVLTGGPVCIKHCLNLSPEDDEILLDEAKVMWDLRHFAIPAVRDVLRIEDSSLALVTSFIEGPTLEKVTQKIGRIPAEHVGWIIERILNALWYLHERGVVHGDLKPQNVIIQHESHMACLVDFGLAMIKPSSSDKCKGYTAYFAPPEQMSGKPLIPQSDFYSLGMFIIYALCGADMRQVAAKAVPSTLPDPFQKFIKRLIVKDPLARPSWETENLFATWQEVRKESFGRDHMNMLPIPGL